MPQLPIGSRKSSRARFDEQMMESAIAIPTPLRALTCPSQRLSMMPSQCSPLRRCSSLPAPPFPRQTRPSRSRPRHARGRALQPRPRDDLRGPDRRRHPVRRRRIGLVGRDHAPRHGPPGAQAHAHGGGSRSPVAPHRTSARTCRSNCGGPQHQRHDRRCAASDADWWWWTRWRTSSAARRGDREATHGGVPAGAAGDDHTVPFAARTCASPRRPGRHAYVRDGGRRRGCRDHARAGVARRLRSSARS